MTRGVVIVVAAAALTLPPAAGAQLKAPPGPWPTNVVGADNPLIGTPFGLNGASATANAQLDLWLEDGNARRTAITRPIGARTVVRGRLRDRSTRRSVSGAVVQIAAQSALGGPWVVATTARTSREGLLRSALRPGATVRVGALYWPFVSSVSPIFSRRLLVRAGARVTLTPRMSGRSILFRGRVSGARIPPGGVLVAAQVRNGPSWATVRLVRTFSGGTFRARYRFKLRNRTFSVRATVPAQPGWPLYAGSSAVSRVRAR